MLVQGKSDLARRPSSVVCFVQTLDLPLLTHPRHSINFLLLRPRSDAMSTTMSAPLVGRLVPLRTKDEVRASLETQPVWVVEVPAKFANVIKE